MGENDPVAPHAQGPTRRGPLAYLAAHPVGFWYIFLGELAERCSFYGIRTLLFLYLTEVFRFSTGDATRVGSIYKAGCYLTPLLGGFLADRYFGKYWTIVAFSIPYVIGQLLLTNPDLNYLYAGLALLALGSGVIKPNISSLMGMTYDQKRPGQTKLRSDAFYMYYFAINLGSVISTFSLPILQRERGYADAFLVPAVLMAIALGFFAAGKRHYAVETPGTAQAQTPEETAEQWQALLRLAGVFALVVVWWALYDQHDHLWTAFAKAHVNLQLFGYELRPNQLIALNPFCILAFVPLLNLSFKALDPDGRRFPPATKMLIGFLLAILTSGILALASYLAESTGEKVSMGWMVAAFVIQVISEVLVSVVGLELAFAMAPPKMKSQLTACWQVTVFGGNLLNYVIAPYYDGVGPAVFFAAMTALAAGATAAFYFIARRFNQATTPEQAP